MLASPEPAQVCNPKVVTDASPDYTDVGSMIHSITSNWEKPEGKCWALWYWSQILNLRQHEVYTRYNPTHFRSKSRNSGSSQRQGNVEPREIGQASASNDTNREP